MSRPISIGIDGAYDGPVQRFDRALEIEAMAYNPLITEDTAGAILAIISQRRGQFETQVIAELEALMQIQDGLLESLSFVGEENLMQARVIMETIKPLMSTRQLLDEASSAGILDENAARVHRELIQAYRQDVQAEVARENPTEVTNELFRMVLRNDAREAVLTYRDLLAESATRPDAVLAAIAGELPDGVADRLRTLKADRAELAADQRARDEVITNVELAMRPLSLDQRRAMLEAIVASRGSNADRLLPIIDLSVRPADFWEDNPELKPEGAN